MEPRLREIKVVLIRNMISDQLRYINIARKWFTMADLAEIRRHKIGHGRIGGKAAGMLLAYKILEQSPNEELRQNLRTPESYFLGSDLLIPLYPSTTSITGTTRNTSPKKRCGGTTPRSSRISPTGTSRPASSSDLKPWRPQWASGR